MKYAECFYQSMKGKAAVKCTYAEVCNLDGTPIFSFQKRCFSGTIAVATFDPAALRPNYKIVATLTDEAVDILTEYYNTYVMNTANHNKRRKHTSNYKYLSDYFDVDGNMISRTVTINPFRYTWFPEKSITNNTSNIALLVAAGSALLD